MSNANHAWRVAQRIPKDFPVTPILPGATQAQGPTVATCCGCGLSWDDAISTGYTPAPSARCPFEVFHEPSDDEIPAIEQRGAFIRVLSNLIDTSYSDADDAEATLAAYDDNADDAEDAYEAALAGAIRDAAHMLFGSLTTGEYDRLLPALKGWAADAGYAWNIGEDTR